MKDNGYYVYIHKNKINNKVYIGITSQEPKQRWRNGTNYYRNEYFNRAIQKYGWNEGFEHKILFENLSKKEAEDIEVKLIKEYDSTNRSKGYNIEGGGSTKGKHSKETIRKISESQKGEKNHMYGVTGNQHHSSKKVVCLNDFTIYDSISEATSKRNTNKAIGQVCEGKRTSCGKDSITNESLLWMWFDDYVKMTNDDIKEYIVNKKKELGTSYSNNPNAKKIICLITKEVFETAKEACEKYEISPSALSQCLNGERNNCKSKKLNVMLTFMLLDSYDETKTDIIEQKINKCYKKRNASRSKKVIFIEENKVFDSSRELCRYLRDTFSEIFTELYIRKVLKGEMDNYKGLHFKYVL